MSSAQTAAAERKPAAGKKSKPAPLNAKSLVPAWRVLFNAYEAAREAHEAACGPLSVVEKERFATLKLRQIAPLPEILKVQAPAISIDNGAGIKIECPPKDYVLDTAEKIMEHHKGDSDAAEPMMFALAERDVEQQRLDEACGLGALDRRRVECDEAIDATQDALNHARDAFIKFPTLDPEALTAKIEALRLLECPGAADDDAVVAMLATLEAVRAAGLTHHGELLLDEASAFPDAAALERALSLPRTMGGKLAENVAAFEHANAADEAAAAAYELMSDQPDANTADLKALSKAADDADQAANIALARVMCAPAYDMFDLGQQAVAMAHRYYQDGIGRSIVEPATFEHKDAVQALLMSVTGLSARERSVRAALAKVSREAWDAVTTAYWRAKHEADQAERMMTRGYEALERRAPTPEALALYTSLSDIRNDTDLSFGQMTETAQAFIAWDDAREAAKADLGLDAVDDQYHAACAALSAAISTVIHTPAPDILAVVFKSSLPIENEAEGATEDADEFQAILNHSDQNVVAMARMHQDLLRLNGSASEIADVQPWDAMAWIEAFEAHPGWEIDHRCLAPVYYSPEHCRTWGSSPAPAEAYAMFGALAPWQKDAIVEVWGDRPSRKNLHEVIHHVRDWIEIDLVKGIGADEIDREATLAAAVHALGLPEVHVQTARDNLERHGWSRREYQAKHPEVAPALHCQPIREREGAE